VLVGSAERDFQVAIQAALDIGAYRYVSEYLSRAQP